MAQIPFCNSESDPVGGESMYASNTSGTSLLVIAGGTNVPLPNNQVLGGFTATPNNQVFTVPVSGRYYVSYQLNTTVGLLAGTRILRNGTAVPGSILSPSLSTSSYNNDLIVNLNAGDTIRVQFFGLLATVVLVGGGATGAALTVIRLA